MRLSDLPVLSSVFESGAEDRVFDSLLLIGPLLILLIAILGRSVQTEVIAVLYVVVFVSHTLHRSL